MENQKNTVYKCQICGLMVEVIHPGMHPVCCNQPMTELQAKTQDEGNEKHLPVIEKTSNGYRVTVGSIPHPMLPEHHIEWIELVTEQGTQRKYLEAGQEPIAEFCTTAEKITAREYCNVHGLWANQN